MKALQQLRVQDTHGIDETKVGNGNMRREAQVNHNSAYDLNAFELRCSHCNSALFLYLLYVLYLCTTFHFYY